VLYERTGITRLAWSRPWEALNAEVQGLWLADADAVIEVLIDMAGHGELLKEIDRMYRQ